MSGPTTKKEAFSRVLIDKQLLDVGWDLTDGVSVRYEYQLPDGTFADYVLCDRNGRSLAVIEAKRHSKSPRNGERQGRAYAEQLKVPYVFLANGEEVLFWDYHNEAHPRSVAGFFGQADLERRAARGQLRVDPLSKPIDRRIVERDYQINCIDVLCREINNGRRKLLVEMATGTGKTRTAAALFKRLFDANVVTRVLFLVDRITLAKQTEDAFAEHLPDLPCYVLRTGRRFQDEKLVTITTLQSMINLYRDYSPGYFDLIVTDECHRSIYGQWSGILKYFDGIQIGLTATPFTSEIETGEEEDKLFVRDTLRFFEVKEPTFRYTLREAIEDQHLVPYQIYKAKTVKTASQGGFKVKKNELDWSAMSTKEKQEFEALFKEKGTITVDPNALERRFTIPARNLAMVQEFRQVLENGYQDKKGVLRKPGLGKTIVFAVTKRHAETLANLFDTAFADQKPSPEIRYADFVVSGCGPDDTLDAAAKIRRFKKEKFPQILVSVNMLDTGFDAPDVVNLVMARYTKSVVLYRQMRGRGTRKAPGKQRFTLFDFVGITDLHDNDEAMPEGGLVRDQRKGEVYEPRTLLTLGINDSIDANTREWITIDENGNFVFLDANLQQQIVFSERFETWLAGRDDLHGEEQRLLLSIGAVLKANAGQGVPFTLDHFRVPPFANSGGLARALQTFGGEERLRAVLESLNRAIFDETDPGRDETYPLHK